MREYLRFQDLKRLGVVCNRPTLMRWVAQEGFPRPFKLGPNTVAWDAKKVRDWIEARRAEAA